MTSKSLDKKIGILKKKSLILGLQQGRYEPETSRDARKLESAKPTTKWGSCQMGTGANL